MPIYFNKKMSDKIPCLYTFQDGNAIQNIWDKLFSCKSFMILKCLVINDLQLKNLTHMFWLAFPS